MNHALNADYRYTRVSDLIKANDWAALDLPTPEELTASLASGESHSDINGHFVVYDQEDDMTWITNPYGVDGVLCNGVPTVNGIRSFLTDMARGVEYGPVP